MKNDLQSLQRWLRKDGLALVAGWRRWGCDVRGVAKKMGISFAQLKRWANAHKELSVALEIDAEAADFLVEEVLFRRAVEGEQKAAELWMKHRKGGVEAARDEASGGVDVLRLARLINEE